jgi:membrane protein
VAPQAPQLAPAGMSAARRIGSRRERALNGLSQIEGLPRKGTNGMIGYFDVHVGWKEIVRRTVRDTLKDDAQGLAAQLSYYFFLSLFPTLLFLIALASLFPLQNLVDDITRLLGPVMPREALTIIREQMVKIADSDDTALLSIGLLAALWSSSAAMGAVVNAMNRAYDIEDARPWWKVRLLSIALTVGLAFFILLSLTLVLAGPEFADFAARWLGMPWVFAAIWKVVQWPVVFFLVATGIGLIYYFAPDAEQDWVWITPGSLVATLLWLLASLGFRYYVVNFGQYTETYGAIGGIIVILLWFYLSALAIVIGAELNAEIERASPWGKKPGEKVPGERRVIGAAASREYHAKGRLRPDAA